MMEYLPWGERVYFTSYFLPRLTGRRNTYPRYFPDPSSPTINHQAFHAPINALYLMSSVPSVAATGEMTPGIHKFLLVIESKSGHLTYPSPWETVTVSGLTETRPQPLYYAVNSPNRMIQVRFQPQNGFTWPSSYARAHLIMTTVSNPARWFRAPIPPKPVVTGTNLAIDFVVSDSDSVVAQGEDVTYLLDRLFNPTAEVSGVIYPGSFPTIRAAFRAGSRVGWISASLDADDPPGTVVPPPGSGVYFSDPGQPEVISYQYHFKGLPGGLEVVAGVAMDSKIYLLGQDWTYATVDTGGYPVTWPDPTPISQTIGTGHPSGICVNPSKYALVGHESGLYILRANGYDDKPLSWFQQADWNKIIWIPGGANVGGTIVPFHIVEDAEARLIFVQCITSDYPEGCLYVWDYSEGLRWDRVKFSIWTFTGGAGAIALPHNFGDSESSQVRQQLAIYPFGNGNASLRRRGDSLNPYIDSGGEVINSQYKTCYLGQQPDKQVHQFNGLSFNADGVGPLRITAYGIDDVPSTVLRNTDISTLGRMFHRRFLLKSEGCSFLFRNGTTPGDRFRLMASPNEPMEVYSIPYGWRKLN
jgi:hypothetical protein